MKKDCLGTKEFCKSNGICRTCCAFIECKKIRDNLLSKKEVKKWEQ